MPFEHKRTFNIDKNKDLRRDLRNYPTSTEKKMWEVLKNSGFEDLKFRRQHGIGNYIIDFYCPEKKLVIEIDGIHHKEKDAKNYDKKRTAFLELQDLKVLRFSNEVVDKDLSGVLEVIKEALK